MRYWLPVLTYKMLDQSQLMLTIINFGDKGILAMSAKAVLLAFLFPTSLSAQFIEEHRKVDWSLAGTTLEVQPSSQIIDIMTVGGIADQSASNSSAIQTAILQLNGGQGSIYFPNGTYLFDQTISLPDNTWLIGESNNSKLVFNLGGTGHCIEMAGGQSLDTVWVASPVTKGEMELEVANPSLVSAGEMLRIGMTDDDLVTSDWALGFVGQCVMIESITGNTVHLQDPLNLNLELARQPFAVRIIPRVNAGIECLSIERLDDAVDHYINIDIERAFNCKVKSVISDKTVFAHVGISSSCHIEVIDSYFKNAFSYGGGGEGYGAAIQYASSYNLVESNVFEHLRHAMLLQAGANANVFAYNYSLDAFWEGGGLPSNAAGDIVLHGNYPYLNLFEGNVAQNIIVDASHGINGPFNTFFRNRAELYGVVMDNNVATDSLNWIANEVSSTGFPFGNFALYGTGHLVHGNNVFGVVTPLGTESISDTSLYLDFPLTEFQESWPLIGFPAMLDVNELPAQERYTLGEFTSCADAVITKVEDQVLIWQDQVGKLRIDDSLTGASFKVYSVHGKLVKTGAIHSNEILQLSEVGIYLIEVNHVQLGTKMFKFIGGQP
ncbi:MAG: hypothetical protein ACI9YU_000288 [Flavobacteriales bacterium]|jgi:hypothetical protein